ncbi:hypothetical protein [Tunturiibacter lichenicola]|uniref:hypothetical protein n=1 Tax=Tunturiibacter lichenicola TaxID=2051959 RepID=UPI003D9B2BE6
MILSFALLAFAALQQQPPISNPCATGYTENVWDPRFTPGQHWSYRARPIDKDSTLFITKIDYVPELGVVLQILVDHVDFEDKPGDRPVNNYRHESMAIRRDSLDSSVLTLLGVIGTTGSPDNYGPWTKNCGGLTYATTVADTLKTLQEAYLDRLLTFTASIALHPTSTDKPQKLTLSLTQRDHSSPVQSDLKVQISTEGTAPIKDGQVEIVGPSSLQSEFHVRMKTQSGGTFEVPSMPTGNFQFRLTLDGFRTMIGTLTVSPGGVSLYNLRSAD